MVRKKPKTIQFRRKREGRTNYGKRLKLLLSETPRMVIRKSLNNTKVQFVVYEPSGDKIVAATDSKSLEKMGWKGHKGNIPSAYMTGFTAAKKALGLNIKEAIVDIGNYSSTKGSRLYAAVKGAVDAGLNVACDKSMFPSDERIKGKNTKSGAEIAQMIKKIEGKN